MIKANLNTPYKILPSKYKRYQKHYDLPSENCVVVPTKAYGDQAVCNVMWKNDTGQLLHKADLMFDLTNLESLSAIKDFILYELWESHHNHDFSLSNTPSVSDAN
jgi:hypothetical protein